MSRTVFRASAHGRSADTPYHLFVDCTYLGQTSGEPSSYPLESLWDDVECCDTCIRRAFVLHEGCSRCDGPHEIDPDTLVDTDSAIEAPCPEGGFVDLIPPTIFQERLESAGVDIDDVRRVVGAVAADGGRPTTETDLSVLLNVHESIDWREVPGIGVAEAATWCQRLQEAYEALDEPELVADGGPGIYLAGPIENDDTPRSWRDELRDRFPDVNWIDPMDWQDEWEADPGRVWERELETCRTGAVLACNIGTDGPKTTGTHHEIREALNHGQPVAVVPNGDVSEIYRDIEDVRLFDDVEEAIRSLTGPEAVADGGQLIEEDDEGLVEIAFADESIEPILSGEKTVTYRVDFEYDLEPMQEVSLVDGKGDEFERAYVATQSSIELGGLSSISHVGHREYSSAVSLAADLARYYPSNELTPWTEVDVIAFSIKTPHDEMVARPQEGSS